MNMLLLLNNFEGVHLAHPLSGEHLWCELITFAFRTGLARACECEPLWKPRAVANAI
jgi:hypothetical protein